MPKNCIHFLGLASYYRRFIPNFTQIAKCLHQLVGLTNVKKTKGKRKEATTLEEQKKPELTLPKFVWESEHQKAFDALKLALTTAPVLGYPDFEREVYPRNRCLTKRAGSCFVPS